MSEDDQPTAPHTACRCGQPEAAGVVHRADGPCYVAASVARTAEQVIHHLTNTQPAEVSEAFARMYPELANVITEHPAGPGRETLARFRRELINALGVRHRPADTELLRLATEVIRLARRTEPGAVDQLRAGSRTPPGDFPCCCPAPTTEVDHDAPSATTVGTDYAAEVAYRTQVQRPADDPDWDMPPHPEGEQ
jgi:hypothetical protein